MVVASASGTSCCMLHVLDPRARKIAGASTNSVYVPKALGRSRLKAAIRNQYFIWPKKSTGSMSRSTQKQLASFSEPGWSALSVTRQHRRGAELYQPGFCVNRGCCATAMLRHMRLSAPFRVANEIDGLHARVVEAFNQVCESFAFSGIASSRCRPR